MIQLEQKFKNQADEEVDLKKLPSAKGIWAPCLTYCEAEDMFYVVYGVMNSMNARIPVEDKPIYLRLYIEGRRSWFEWSYDGKSYEKIGRIFDTTRFSDEYCKYGEFTGTMVGITYADRVLHKKCADFDFFEYKADESRMVE